MQKQKHCISCEKDQNGKPVTFPSIPVYIDGFYYGRTISLENGKVTSTVSLGKLNPNAKVKFSFSVYNLTLLAKDVNGTKEFVLNW